MFKRNIKNVLFEESYIAYPISTCIHAYTMEMNGWIIFAQGGGGGGGGEAGF